MSMEQAICWGVLVVVCVAARVVYILMEWRKYRP